MATRKCSGCGATARKMSLAYVPDVAGKVRQARVCVKCISRAVVIVPIENALECGCGQRVAKWCWACVEKREEAAKRGAADANALAKVLMDRSKMYDPEPNDYGSGLHDGLEMAANFLLQGKW